MGTFPRSFTGSRPVAAPEQGHMTHLDPFLLSPVFSDRPWGGTGLAAYGKNLPDGALIGESWEVADLPDGVAKGVADPRSRVASGPYVGLTLSDLILGNESALMGEAEPTPEGRFPLLVKLIHAREPLSVQVHPHAEYVAEHPEARLKTESWYIVDADEGAELFVDFADGVSDDDIEEAMGSSEIVPLLGRVPVSVGDFQHVPAGLVHAIGAGIILAEIQTPSDTTFRIYDWSEELGRAPREMHPSESLASIRRNPSEAFSIPASGRSGVRDLIECDHYWMREHRPDSGTIALRETGGPTVLLVIEGSMAIDRLTVEKGGTAMIPSCSTPAVVASNAATVLEVGLVP